LGGGILVPFKVKFSLGKKGRKSKDNRGQKKEKKRKHLNRRQTFISS